MYPSLSQSIKTLLVCIPSHIKEESAKISQDGYFGHQSKNYSEQSACREKKPKHMVLAFKEGSYLGRLYL